MSFTTASGLLPAGSVGEAHRRRVSGVAKFLHRGPFDLLKWSGYPLALKDHVVIASRPRFFGRVMRRGAGLCDACPI